MSISRNTIYGALGNIAVAVFGFVSNLYLVHNLDKGLYGQFIIMLAFVSVFFPFMELGFASFYTVKGSKNRERIPVYFFRSIVYKTILLFFVAPIISIAYLYKFGQFDSFILVLISYLYFQSILLGSSNVAFLPSEKIGMWAYRRAVQEALLLIFYVLAISVFARDDVKSLMVAVMIASLIGLSVLLIEILGRLKFHKKVTKKDVLNVSLKDEISGVLPFTIYDIALLFFYQSNVIILSMLSSDESVADYRVVYLVMQMIIFVQKGFSLAVMPRLALYSSESRRSEFDNLLQSGLSIIIFYAALILAWGSTCGGDAVVWLFGVEYVSASGVWYVLLPGVCFLVMQGYMAGLLNYLGRERVYTLQAITCLAIGFIISLSLAEEYGALGVAIATTLSSGFLLFLNIYIVHNKIKAITMPIMAIAKYIIILLLIFAIGESMLDLHVFIRSFIILLVFGILTKALGMIPAVIEKQIEKIIARILIYKKSN